MNKKLLFICFQDIKSAHGISNKIIAQKKAFIKNGIDTELAFVHDEEGVHHYMIDSNCIGVHKPLNHTLYRLFYSYPLFYKYINKSNIKQVYIRLIGNVSFGILILLLLLKLHRIKIIVEIPTYPYDKEALFEGQSFLAQLPNKIDKILRHLLFLFVSFIVTYSEDKKIWNIPCINISNGYIPELTRIKKKTPLKDTINLIAVAYIQKWHGFDRIIKGMHNYLSNSPKMNIHLTIIGDGDIEELLTLSNQLQLNDYITFTGALSGESLNQEFDKAHFAIGSLGRHRSGLKSMRSLKNVEYASRGICFTYSEDNPDFDNKPFILKMPANESAIEINSIINFIKNQTLTPEEIHQYTLPFTWDNQIKEVILKANLSK